VVSEQHSASRTSSLVLLPSQVEQLITHDPKD